MILKIWTEKELLKKTKEQLIKIILKQYKQSTLIYSEPSIIVADGNKGMQGGI